MRPDMMVPRHSWERGAASSIIRETPRCGKARRQDLGRTDDSGAHATRGSRQFGIAAGGAGRGSPPDAREVRAHAERAPLAGEYRREDQVGWLDPPRAWARVGNAWRRDAADRSPSGSARLAAQKWSH